MVQNLMQNLTLIAGFKFRHLSPGMAAITVSKEPYLTLTDLDLPKRCELCPSRDGALKRTDNNGWAHVVCALYIPEVRFGNVTTMEPIILQLIPPERFSKVCYICEEQGKGSRAAIGACMQCNKSGCKQQFHVTCAQALGLLCEEAGNYLDNVKYCGYCQHHYSKLKKGGNVKTIPPYKPIPADNCSSDSSPEKESESIMKQGLGGKRKSGGKSNIVSGKNSVGKLGCLSPGASDSLSVSPDMVGDTTKGPSPFNKDVSISGSSNANANSGNSKFTTSNFIDNVMTQAASLQPSVQVVPPAAVVTSASGAYQQPSVSAPATALTAAPGTALPPTTSASVCASACASVDEVPASSRIATGILEELPPGKRARFHNGVSAPHMLGNQLNPSSMMAQKMSDTLSQELEAHSIFNDSSSTTSNLVGPPLHSRVIASVRSGQNLSSSITASSSGNGSGSSPGTGTIPQSLDQLLERQWEQGSQFLMEQAQHFDIASLLSCLHQLRAENLRLEEHVNSLLQRRDHLLAVNARLAIPLTSQPPAQVNNIHPTPGAATHHPELSRSARINNNFLAHSLENGLPQESSPPAVSLSYPHQHRSPLTVTSSPAERTGASQPNASIRPSPASGAYMSQSSLNPPPPPGATVTTPGVVRSTSGTPESMRSNDGRRSGYPVYQVTSPNISQVPVVTTQQMVRRETISDLHVKMPTSKPG